MADNQRVRVAVAVAVGSSSMSETLSILDRLERAYEAHYPSEKGRLEFVALNRPTTPEMADKAVSAQGQNSSENRRSALQNWVMGLTIMQQSVLLAAVRGPDGISKNHPVKVLLRWYRRSILLSAFDGKALLDPYTPGGGSFTGPLHKLEDISDYCKKYLNHVDELPHHFQLHFMHAAEILGYKHPLPWIRRFWYEFYLNIVNDAHLVPEPEEWMDKRLGDNEGNWRKAEVVTAK